jgi:hypothetical protein
MALRTRQDAADAMPAATRRPSEQASAPAPYHTALAGPRSGAAPAAAYLSRYAPGGGSVSATQAEGQSLLPQLTSQRPRPASAWPSPRRVDAGAAAVAGMRWRSGPGGGGSGSRGALGTAGSAVATHTRAAVVPTLGGGWACPGSGLRRGAQARLMASVRDAMPPCLPADQLGGVSASSILRSASVSRGGKPDRLAQQDTGTNMPCTQRQGNQCVAAPLAVLRPSTAATTSRVPLAAGGGTGCSERDSVLNLSAVIMRDGGLEDQLI